MKLIRIALLIMFVALNLLPVAWGAGDEPSSSSMPTLTFYHHSVGTCYLDNGLREVIKRHGYKLAAVYFPPKSNCPCDLKEWFAANPAAMTGTVLVKSCFFCSNLWSNAEVSQARTCYQQLHTQAKANGANLYLISPPPYDRVEMERNDWRINAQRGADLMDLLETDHTVDPFLNAHRILRDVDGGLPYIAKSYVKTPGDSHPNDAGCRAVVKAIDAWLPYVKGEKRE